MKSGTSGPTDLNKGEALGQIKSMKQAPEKEAPKQVTDETNGIIDNAEEFRMAIGNAQMENLEYVEVSERLYKFLLKNRESNYLTYGDPGIKVYRAGTKKKCDREDNMPPERLYQERMLKAAAERDPLDDEWG